MAGELIPGTVVATSVVDLDAVGDGDVPTALVDWLRVTLGSRVCFALIENNELRSTVVLEADRAGFAGAVSRLSRAMDQHVGIPWSFASAVIDRWPQEWVGNREAAIRVDPGPSAVPHIFLSDVPGH